MKKKKIKYIVCLILVLFMVNSVSIQGQEPPKTATSSTSEYNEKVVVTAPYQPTLEAIYKPTLTPSFADTVVEITNVDYDIISRPVNTVYPIENIKPAKVTGEPIPKLFNQHIKIGFGTHLSPLAEAYFSMGRSKQYALSASYRHLSGYGYVKDYHTFKTDHSLNEADVLGEIFADKFTVGLKVNYHQKKVNCYGYKDGNHIHSPEMGEFETNPVRWYQNVGGSLFFKDNSTRLDDWKFDAALNYNLNLTNWKSSENFIGVDGGFDKSLLVSDKNVDRLSIGTRIFFGDYTYRDGIRLGNGVGNQLQNAFIFELMPKISYRYSIFQLEGALKLNIFGQGKDPVKVQFNPILDLQIHAVENILTAFVGVGGDVERSTVLSISEINPFLHPLDFTDMSFMQDKFQVYLGVKGNFSRNIDYRLQLSVHWKDHVQNFDYYGYRSGVAGTVGYNDFLPIYTNKVFNFRAKGEVNFRWSERILAHVEATYNYYNKDLSYTPAFEAKVSFRYNIGNKFIITSEILGYTNMKAFDRYGKPSILKGCFDWSVGFEYRFLKRWSTFVNLNNLIAQRYFRWYDYPSYRFNCMLGVTVAF
ncbi:MAG: hypothetical protein RR393_05615 [Bacteroidales bacterium]